MLWVYRLADNVFLRDLGAQPLASGEASIDVLRVPDAVNERYSGDAQNPIRPATAPELTAMKAALASALGDEIVAQAVAQAAFEEINKCTVRAGQTLLTAPQFRARIRALIAAQL